MRDLWRSPTIRTTVAYGAAGVGFAGANLILARVLPTAEYGVFTLVVAVISLSFALAPLGADEVVNRRRLEAGPRLLGRVLAAGSAVGFAFATVGAAGYGLAPPLVLLLFVATVAGGAMLVAGAQFQSEHRFGVSLAILQSPNLVLLVAALAVVASGVYRAWLPLVIFTAGYVVAAAVGWARLFRERHRKPFRGGDVPWREALSLAGLNAAGLLLLQLERLVIPSVLPLRDLATYGVLAAIAGSLFRVLQMGVGYSLVPRLRAAETVRERRRLIAHEARLAGGVAAAGAAVIWAVTPVVERHLLAGKYHLGAPLLLAAVVSGAAKILNAFSKATVTALATPREVWLLNLLGWLSAALAVAAAVIGARWGLVGVIYGVGLGWLVRALSAFYVTARHLRAPAAVTVAASPPTPAGRP